MKKSMYGSCLFLLFLLGMIIIAIDSKPVIAAESSLTSYHGIKDKNGITYEKADKLYHKDTKGKKVELGAIWKSNFVVDGKTVYYRSSKNNALYSVSITGKSKKKLKGLTENYYLLGVINKKLYLYKNYGKNVGIYVFSSGKLKSIKVVKEKFNNDRPFGECVLYNGKIYYTVKEVNNNDCYDYKLYEYNVSTKKTKKIAGGASAKLVVSKKKLYFGLNEEQNEWGFYQTKLCSLNTKGKISRLVKTTNTVFNTTSDGIVYVRDNNVYAKKDGGSETKIAKATVFHRSSVYPEFLTSVFLKGNDMYVTSILYDDEDGDNNQAILYKYNKKTGKLTTINKGYSYTCSILGECNNKLYYFSEGDNPGVTIIDL